MMKSSFFFILILCQLLTAHGFSATLFELEKMRAENTTTQQDLLVEIQLIQQKIINTQYAIAEKKTDLIKFLRADQQLNKFQFGGLMAVENWPRLNRNLEIFQKIKLQNINSLRELKFASADFQRQQEILLRSTERLKQLNQQLIDQEQQITLTEKITVEKMKLEKTDSLLIYKGTLSPPVSASEVLTQQNLKTNLKIKFGPRNDSKNQYTIFHKGLTFYTRAHQDIHAVGPGKIIFRDRIKYWGESIIIEHAGNYYSVYTNLTNCRVENNQIVSQDEKICETNGNEFYFELRNQNIAINPQNWIRN